LGREILKNKFYSANRSPRQPRQHDGSAGCRFGAAGIPNSAINNSLNLFPFSRTPRTESLKPFCNPQSALPRTMNGLLNFLTSAAQRVFRIQILTFDLAVTERNNCTLFTTDKDFQLSPKYIPVKSHHAQIE